MIDVALFKTLISYNLKDFAKLGKFKNVWELKQFFGIKDPKQLISLCRVTSFHNLYRGVSLSKVLDQFYKELSDETESNLV